MAQLLRGSGLPVCTRHPSGTTLNEVTAVVHLPAAFAVRRTAVLAYFADAPAAYLAAAEHSSERGARFTGRELNDSKEDAQACVAEGKRDLFNMR